jgi:glycosyltransferase involved in cell wall biosynthesis
MFAGNIGFAQSIENIFKAACELRNFHNIQFVIIGDGSRRFWLENAIQTEGLNNIFLPGQFSMNKMPHLLGQADILLATLCDQEIFNLTIPNKIQAYMAVGKPILCAINGSAANLINDSSCGLAIPADDSLLLSQAILKMYEMPKDELIKFGENGQSYFKKNFLHVNLVSELDMHIKKTVGMV